MRCKNHYTDLSSIVGVCASCLRERLFYLIATQSQSQSLTLDERNNNLEHHHPVFPRSVSPYITRRKSDTALSTSNQRFFSTPQVGPTVGGYNNNNNNNINNNNVDIDNNNNNNKKKKHSFIRFSLLSKLFRSRKQKESVSDSDPDPNPRVSVSVSASNSGGSYGGGDSYQYQTSTSAMSSPFRFLNIRSSSRNHNRNRNKQPLGFSECSTRAGTVNRNQYCSDRGMSPVRLSNCVEDEFYDGSSGYETCESRKLTPAHPAVKRGGGGGGGYTKNVSGLTFCLSPLVRTSPCRNWNLPADGGETRAPVKPHLSNTKSFCANRSRKLADFGRFNSNR